MIPSSDRQILPEVFQASREQTSSSGIDTVTTQSGRSVPHGSFLDPCASGERTTESFQRVQHLRAAVSLKRLVKNRTAIGPTCIAAFFPSSSL